MRDSRQALATYLTDHHAGSVGAREVLAKAINHDAPDRELFQLLDQQIAEEQQSLEKLIEHVHGDASLPKVVGAWVGEKLSRFKLGFSDDALGYFEMLESLLLGIRGKRALWEALDSLPSGALPLEALGLGALITRAKDQLEKVESARRAAFAKMVIH
jgi:hypothetical protein